MAVLGPGGRSFTNILEAAQWYTDYFFKDWKTGKSGYIVPRCFESVYEFPRSPASGFNDSQDDIEQHIGGEDSELQIYKLIETLTSRNPVLAFHSVKYSQPQQILLEALCPGLHAVYKENLHLSPKIKGENVEEDFVLFSATYGIAVVEVKSAKSLNAAKKHLDHAGQETIPKLEALIAAIANFFKGCTNIPILKVIVFPNIIKSKDSERRLYRKGFSILTAERLTEDNWETFWKENDKLSIPCADLMPFLSIVLALKVGTLVNTTCKLHSVDLSSALNAVSQKIKTQSFLKSDYSRWFEINSCGFLLTPEQHKIWTHCDKKLILRGIAGTGKTLLIQAKILNLLGDLDPGLKIVVIIPSTLKENYEWAFQNKGWIVDHLLLKTFEDYVTDSTLQKLISNDLCHVFIDEAPLFFDICHDNNINVNFNPQENLHRWLAEDIFQVRIDGEFCTVEDVVKGFTITELTTVLRCTPDIADFWEVEYGRNRVSCGCNVPGPLVTVLNYDLEVKLSHSSAEQKSFMEYTCERILAILTEQMASVEKEKKITETDVGILCNNQEIQMAVRKFIEAHTNYNTCSVSSQLKQKGIAFCSFKEAVSQEWLLLIVIHSADSGEKAEGVSSTDQNELVALASKVAELQETTGDKNFYLAYSRARTSLTVIKEQADRLCVKRNTYVRKLISIVAEHIEQLIPPRLIQTEGYPNWYPFYYIKFQKIVPENEAYSEALKLYSAYVMNVLQKVRRILTEITNKYVTALRTRMKAELEENIDILQYIVLQQPSAEDIWFFLPIIVQESFNQFFKSDAVTLEGSKCLSAAAALHHDFYLIKVTKMFHGYFDIDEEETDHLFLYEDMVEQLFPNDCTVKEQFLANLTTLRRYIQPEKQAVVTRLQQVQHLFQIKSSPTGVSKIIVEAIGDVANGTYAAIVDENVLGLKLFNEEKFLEVSMGAEVSNLKIEEFFSDMPNELREYAAMQVTVDAIVFLIYSAGFMIELVPY